jgi:hypothetical protein
MKIRLILLSLLWISLAACGGMKVNVDYDQSYDFSRLKTWTWRYAEQPQAGDKFLDNPLRDQRIRGSIETVLTEKGLTKASANTDFLVSYELKIETKEKTSNMSIFVGTGTWGSHGGVSVGAGAPIATSTTPYNVGTLFIDFVDPASGNLLWRGTGQATLSESGTPEENKAAMLEAVRKIMQDYPPKKAAE